MTDIDKCLKQALLNKGLSVTELAKQMGRSRGTLYSAFSNGNPSLKTVEDVAGHLGYSLSQFTALDGG